VQQNAVSDDVSADDERHQRMMRSDHELDFGMMLEAKLLMQTQSGPTTLRVFVRDVARTGAAQRHGTVLYCLVLPRLMFIIIIIVIIIYLPRTHTTQRARRTNSIWQVRQG